MNMYIFFTGAAIHINIPLSFLGTSIKKSLGEKKVYYFQYILFVSCNKFIAALFLFMILEVLNFSWSNWYSVIYRSFQFS